MVMTDMTKLREKNQGDMSRLERRMAGQRRVGDHPEVQHGMAGVTNTNDTSTT
jgi:hypothetical protein